VDFEADEVTAHCVDIGSRRASDRKPTGVASEQMGVP
jgi:hypothetical protein